MRFKGPFRSGEVGGDSGPGSKVARMDAYARARAAEITSDSEVADLAVQLGHETGLPPRRVDWRAAVSEAERRLSQ